MNLRLFVINYLIDSAICFSERKRSNAGEEQTDYLASHTIKSEIIYTVTDVSQVEQGKGGFVKSIRGKVLNVH